MYKRANGFGFKLFENITKEKPGPAVISEGALPLGDSDDVGIPPVEINLVILGKFVAPFRFYAQSIVKPAFLRVDALPSGLLERGQGFEGAVAIAQKKDDRSMVEDLS